MTDMETARGEPMVAAGMTDGEEVCMQDYPEHLAAALFPRMTEAELEELTKDIKENGLRNPISLHEGQILDGRNRRAACEKAGVKPRYEDANLNGDSAVRFVVSQNLHRRQLTTSQRAVVGVALLPQLEREAAERKRAGGENGRFQQHGGSVSGDTEPKTYNESRSKEIAAQTVSVSSSTIFRAERVQKADPALFEKIGRGEIEVHSAYRKIKSRPSKKRDKSDPNAFKRSRQYDHRRMVEGLSMIRGLCRGLDELRIPLLISLPPNEKETWAAIASEVARNLRTFARNLRGETDAANNDDSDAKAE